MANANAQAICKTPCSPRLSDKPKLTKRTVVKLPFGQVITLTFDFNTATVADVKAVVNTRHEADREANGVRVLRSDVPMCDPTLRFAGRYLEKEKTLAACNLQRESTLHVQYNSWRQKDERRLHYEPETRTKYYSKAQRRADRARRAKTKQEAGVENGPQAAGKKQAEPQHTGSETRQWRNDRTTVQWERYERGLGTEDEALETEDESMRSMPNSEVSETDDEGDNERGEDTSFEKSTNDVCEEEAGAQDKDPNGESTAEIDEGNIQAVEGMFEQDTNSQQENFPLEVEEGILVEMQWWPDPFATADEDKENWDPQLFSHRFAWPVGTLGGSAV